MSRRKSSPRQLKGSKSRPKAQRKVPIISIQVSVYVSIQPYLLFEIARPLSRRKRSTNKIKYFTDRYNPCN